MSENTKRETNPTLFKDVNFYVSGEIDDSVVQTLENSGATHSKYFSDFVSHLLCGSDPEENDLIDASDVYEIPAILPQWVEMCIKLHKLVDTKPYAYGRQRIFAGQTFCLSKPGKDLENLWGLITYHGGTVQLNLDNKCDYLVTTNTSGTKYDKAYHLGSDILTIVTPDWVVESIKAKQLAPHDIYHPKLINWPKPAPSTTTITGFEEESKENASKSDVVADSTQALLDKLKQRMFLSNQPPPLANKDDVVPPNVTAPMQNALTNQQILQKIQTAKNQHFGQLGQMLSQPQQQLPQQNVMGQQQQVQQNVMSQQVGGMAQQQVQQQLLSNPQQQTQNLRGLVHHAPQQQQQPQQQQTQFLQQQNQGLNRLLGPQQQRPMQQQVRAPLNPQQIQQQQLLQQRINQVQMLQQQQRLLAQQGQQLGPQQSVQQQQIGAQPQQQQQLLQNQLSQNNQQLVNRIQQQAGQKLAPHQITQLLQQRQQQLAQQQQQQGHQPQQLLPNQQQLLQNRILQQQQQQQQGQQINQQLIQTPMSQQQQSTIDQLSQQQKINQIRQNLMAPMNQPSLPSQFNQQQPMEVSDDQQQQGQINNINQQMGSNQQIINNDQSLGQMSLNQMLGQQHQQVQQQQMPNQQQIQQQLVTQSNQGQQGLQQNQMLKNNINIGQQVNQQQQRMGIQPQQQFMQQNQQETGINQQNINMSQQLGQQQVMQQPQQLLNQQQAPQQQVLGQQQVINQQLGPQQQQLLFNQGQQVVRPQQQQIWQQQQGQQGPQIRQQLNIMQTGPRIQWTSGQQQPNVPQRQFIQLDAQTHHQLQKMPPEQQALFVQRLKQKQLLLQKQAQQRGQMSNTFLIRGSVPPGLSPQQQVAWLQQQAKQQGVVIPNNLQQQTITSTTLNVPPGGAPTQVQQITPGLSPIQQQTPLTEQQQQLQLRQFRLQQLQREQAQKQGPIAQPQPALIRPTDPNTIAADPAQQNPLQPKTKTALANMLSIRLQSGGTSGPQVPGQEPPIAEPSAAGTLRLMTAQHNAALNPNTRGLDLLALQQRRVINGPNGEIIRPPGPVGVGPVATPTEPPKLQFSPRANVVPLQHRPGPFYGHNPNLKLPPDLYLLGCIFVVVEIEDYLNESLPGWEKKIEKHGGEVEKQYCSRVTHVLCETQRHGVVMQALRDCKRCVTVYWLSDIMKRKQVLPPWVALHIPNIYLDTTPASKHLVSISGFTGNERNRVKHMISYTGAKFTSYFSKHNTLLISAKNEGPKFAHAKKWGIPVVNVQWLTEIMLGNFMAMNQTENIIYQQFQQPPNFSFDPKLVPNLMLAWKMAINISQESYERVKRSASPVILPKSPKKPKLENIVDENANIDNSHANPCYKILFSRSPNLQKLKEVVKTLGGSVAQSHVDCTHLVMPTLARSNKLLFAICRGIPILPEQWLFDSLSQNKFLDENNYSLDTKHFNSEFKCDLSQTLSIKNRNALLQGKYFWVTPSVFPSKKVITELIQNCGGFVEKNRRTSAQIDSVNITSPYSYIIITHEKDIHLVADLLRNKKDKIKIICNAELIFSAILKQTFEVEPYTVKIL